MTPSDTDAGRTANTAESDRVTVDIVDGVADVRLNRPDKLNAIDGPMMDAIRATGERLAANSSVRAVVLSGEGRGFCSGLDMANLADMAGGDLSANDDEVVAAISERSATGANRAQLTGWIWYELPMPVIAAVHGAALGGGMHVALGADFRFVAPDATLGFVEVDWGLVPDLSATQALRRLVPLDVMKELIITTRRIDGKQAKELGLATYVTESPFDDAMEMARVIASKSPDAVRAAKALANRSGLVPLDEGLALEFEYSGALIATPNQIEAVMARFENREPNFADREP